MDQLPILAVLLRRAQVAAVVAETAEAVLRVVRVAMAASLAAEAAEAVLDLRVGVLAAVAVPAKYGS
jgi:hypothetical protein